MKVEQEVLPSHRIRASDLTPEQYQAGMDWLNSNPVAYEYWEHDQTVLVLVQGNAEQDQEFINILNR